MPKALKSFWKGMEAYHILCLIGEGSFGKVYKGRRKECRQVSCCLLAVVLSCHDAMNAGSSSEIHPQTWQDCGRAALLAERNHHHESSEARKHCRLVRLAGDRHRGTYITELPLQPFRVRLYLKDDAMHKPEYLLSNFPSIF